MQCPVVFRLKFALFSIYCACKKHLAFPTCLPFFIRPFSKPKSNPAKKTSEQCFSDETKPTCPNLGLLREFFFPRKSSLRDRSLFTGGGGGGGPLYLGGGSLFFELHFGEGHF